MDILFFCINVLLQSLIFYMILSKYNSKKKGRLIFALILALFNVVFFDLIKTNSIPFYVIVLISYISMIIHELGHYVMARIFKEEVTRVVLGSGKRLFSLGKVEFRLIPFAGAVYIRAIKSRGNFIIFLLGGIMFQLLFVLGAMVSQYTYGPSLILSKIIEVNIYTIFANLLPSMPNLDGYKIIEQIKLIYKNA